MFCGKCGTQIPDGAAFCPSCGNASGAQAPVNNENQPQVVYEAPKPKSKTGLYVGIAAAAAIVVAVAVILICVLAGGSGAGSPEDVVLTYMEAVIDGDIETVVDCMPDDIVDAIVEDEYDGDKDAFIEEGKEYFDQAGAMLQTLDIDFEVTDVEEGDEDEVEAWIEEIYDDYGVELDITAVASVEVEMIMSGEFMGEEVEETESNEFAVIKVDGKWYLHPDSVEL